MRTFKLVSLILGLLLGCSFAQPVAQQTPTAPRAWQSTGGKSITAVASALVDGKVTLRNKQGRTMTVPLSALVEEDQAFLKEHFAPPPLPHETGQSVGPIDAGGGSTYYIYIPEGVDSATPTPLMIFTGAGGGKKHSCNIYKTGLDTFGWMFMAVVHSKNGQPWAESFGHVERCLKHVKTQLPVDSDRLYFSGGSGGGSMSLYNLGNLDGAGALPMICYIPDGANLEGNKGHVFLASGARDYNRYTSANAVQSFGDRAVHRFHKGGHSMAPSWLITDGIAWLDAQHTMTHRRKNPALTGPFETRMNTLLTNLRDSEPHRAYAWALFMIQEYKVNGPNAQLVREIGGGLRKDKNNILYEEALGEIHDFSMQYYTPEGRGSKWSHTTPEMQTAGKKLAEKYEGVPLVDEITTLIGGETVPQKGKK